MHKEEVISQLKQATQALSLEADDQIASFPEFVVVTDELLLEFDHWFSTSKQYWNDYFTEDQANSLEELYNYLDELPEENISLSITEELKTSPFWHELRICAQKTLRILNWHLEKPLLNRITYIKGK